MNKLILMTMLLTSVSFYSKATEGIHTDPLCECEEVSEERVIEKVLCEYHGLDDFGEQVDNPRALWIEVRYTVAVCGSVSQVRVNSFTVHTALGNYINAGYPMSTNSTPCLPPYDMPDFLDPIAWPPWAQYWTNILLAPVMTDPTTDNYIVMYPAGCMSIMKVKWKEGSTLYYPGEGGTAIAVPMDGIESYVTVPCDVTDCCVMEVTNHAPGQLTYTLLNENICDNATPDDTYVPTLSTYNPLDPGTPIIIEADIIDYNSKCSPMCMMEEPSFTTDVNEVQGKLPLVFSANPTLVHDFIRFTSNVPITKIEVYSIQGKKAIDIATDNKELNTSELKAGIYFMRVYFANKELKTIKIQKQ